MANTNPVKYDQTMQLRVDQAFLDDLDTLRATYRPIPGRAEMIRDAIRAAVASLPVSRPSPKRRAP